MKVGAIIQARDGSSRLPGKGMVDICGKPAIQRVVERVQAAKKVQEVVIAMPDVAAETNLAAFCEQMGCAYYQGSEEDVLTRVLEAAKKFDIDVIVEITADCPLIDWNHIDALISLFQHGGVDHVSNIIERTFPRGYDIRVFSRDALERANKEVDNPVDRQHVSTWHYVNPTGKQNYKCLNWPAPAGQNRPDIEVTLDTPEDLELIRWIYGFEKQGYNLELTCEQVIGLIDTYPGEYAKVAKIKRKNYFEELKQADKADKGAKKKDGKVPADNSGVRKTGSGRKSGSKRKNN